MTARNYDDHRRHRWPERKSFTQKERRLGMAEERSVVQKQSSYYNTLMNAQVHGHSWAQPVLDEYGDET